MKKFVVGIAALTLLLSGCADTEAARKQELIQEVVDLCVIDAKLHYGDSLVESVARDICLETDGRNLNDKKIEVLELLRVMYKDSIATQLKNQ